MKQTNWLMLGIFSAAAFALRVWQNCTGFEASGLPIRGNLPGLLLPILFAAAALYFCIAARRLPAQRDVAAGRIDAYFPFRGTTGAALAVMGAFLLLAGAAATFAGMAHQQRELMKLLVPLEAIAALILLYAAFALRRSGQVHTLALLVPICSLVVHLVIIYRADASDPFLARIYVELLAVSLLTISAIQLAAFAFSAGVPRTFVPVSAMAFLLSFTAAADRMGFADEAGADLAALALVLGCALLAIGFLAGAEFDAPELDRPCEPEPDETESDETE